VCAAFGFTPESFEPTYRLVYGSPGRSLALEIAARLGLPAPVIAAARGYQTAREAQLAEHLARMDRELHALEHERRLAAREREQMVEQEGRLRQRDEALRQKEDQLKRRLDAEVEQRVRDARRQIDSVVDDVKRRAANLVSQAARRSAAAQVPLSTGETGAVRAEARASLDQIVDRVLSGVAEAPPAPATPTRPAARPAPGDRVAVGPLGLEGIVQIVHEREAEVNVRGKRLRASLDELRVLGQVSGPPSRVNVSVQVQPRDTSPTELNVIGCTVDEAVSRADKFLDEAVLAELRTVRIIHGHGTGQLRRGLAEYLRESPFVSSFAIAPPEQGGSGATIVELKE
jgi:DNA mismatch repair protein MutS2